MGITVGRARVPAGRLMDSEQPTGLPERRRPAHLPPRDVANRSVVIFLTVCTRDRRPLLANTIMHERLLQAWQVADAWLVGRYVIMPDHLHLFCSPNSYPPTTLSGWISYWKRLVAFEHGGSFWQKNFWDTQLRRHEGYASKWDYVRNNPVRGGLTPQADNWAYQGELNLLRWQD